MLISSSKLLFRLRWPNDSPVRIYPLSELSERIRRQRRLRVADRGRRQSRRSIHLRRLRRRAAPELHLRLRRFVRRREHVGTSHYSSNQ